MSTYRNDGTRRRALMILVATIAALLGLVAGQSTVGVSAGWANPGAAAPLPDPSSPAGKLCSAPTAEANQLLQQIANLRSRIASHNAAAGGVNRYDASQVAAYNARASRLEGEKSALNAKASAARGRVTKCSATAGKLAQHGIPINPLTDATRKKIESALAKVPNTWQGYKPQDMPRRGNGDVTVPAGSPLADLAKIYRSPLKTPKYPYPADMKLQGSKKPLPADINPATGLPYGETKAQTGPNKGQAAVTPDHIVPVVEVIQMPGFAKLTVDQQWWLLNSPLNLQWMDQMTNWMKGSKDVSQLRGVQEQWQQDQKRLQDSLRVLIQEIIDRFIEANGTR